MDDLTYGDLVLAEVLLEMCAARGKTEITEDDMDECQTESAPKATTPSPTNPFADSSSFR